MRKIYKSFQYEELNEELYSEEALTAYVEDFRRRWRKRLRNTRRDLELYVIDWANDDEERNVEEVN